GIQILEGNRNPYAPRVDFANMSMKRSGARNPAGMDQDAIADLEIGCILGELERKRLCIGNNRRGANCPEVIHPELKPAVVEQVGDVLICQPAFALNKSGVFPEIFESGWHCRIRTVTEDVG